MADEPQVIDLMAALKESLREEKERRDAERRRRVARLREAIDTGELPVVIERAGDA